VAGVVSAEAGVAAIERRGILAATLLLPGLAAVTPVRAEEPPEQGVVAFKYGAYRDSQPGWDRIKVNSPQLYVLAPFANVWSIEGSVVSDSVSGATPRMHTSRSGATPAMSDHRSAEDVKVTRYFHRAAVSIGAAYSGENDYVSHAQSVEARWSTEDNNRTFLFGFGHSGDRIDNLESGGSVDDQHRQTREWMVGVTQVLTAADIVQGQITRSLGRGFYSDPYKDFDERPDSRRSTTTLLRWNHFIERHDATLRTSWRYYTDSFGIRAHTLGAEWVQPYGAWTVTPAARYHVQSAAWFYFDPVPDAQGVPDSLATRIRFGGITGFHSADQRLAAFGAVTLSLKVAYEFADGTAVDMKLETYRQSGHLKPRGGSPYLDPFRAGFVQFGVSHKF
jgi:hypothetical protein